jgi:hypothetical protein
VVSNICKFAHSQYSQSFNPSALGASKITTYSLLFFKKIDSFFSHVAYFSPSRGFLTRHRYQTMCTLRISKAVATLSSSARAVEKVSNGHDAFIPPPQTAAPQDAVTHAALSIESMWATVRDALVAMSAHALTSDAVRSLSEAIGKIAGGGDAAGKALFGTAAVRDALVAMSAHALTSDAVRSLSAAIGTIAGGGDAAGKPRFATAAVRDALVAMSQHATTPDAVRWLSEAIGKIGGGADAACKLLFGTAAVRDALVAMSQHATTSDAVRSLSEAIGKIAGGGDAARKALFGTAAVRDALVAMSVHATTSDAVRSLSEAIGTIAGGGDAAGKALFGTAAVRDALVAMSPDATTPDAVRSLSEAICKIAGGGDAACKLLFGTPAVRDALVAMSRHALTSDAVRSLSEAISKIAGEGDAAGKARFGTAAVRDALVAMSAHALTSDAVRWLSAASCNITCGGDAAGKPRFATAAVRDALVAMSMHATTPDAVRSLSEAVDKLCWHFGNSDINRSADVCLTSEDILDDKTIWPLVVQWLRSPLRFGCEKDLAVMRAHLVSSSTAVATFLAIHDGESVRRHELEIERFIDEYSMSADGTDALRSLDSRSECKRAESPFCSRIVFAWQGVATSAVNNICRDGPRSLRTTDAGYFGAGVYFALEAEYAAMYCKPDDASGECALILFAVSVSSVYPVTVEADYRDTADDAACNGFSRFYVPRSCSSMPLMRGYDAHFIPVKQYGYVHPLTGACTARCVDYQAAPAHLAEYHELVVASHHRCLPIAVVYFTRR